MIKKYVEYLKDNPQGLWFKRKLYGWGWTPAKWQGWLVILIFIILITIDSFILDANIEPSPAQITLFFAKILLNVLVLLLICYKTGEKPKWQWGKR